MRYLIAVLHTLAGATVGAAITLAIVSNVALPAGSTTSTQLSILSLPLAGISIACAAALIVIQNPRRTKRTHA
jgi:phosphate/sulfate permease